MPPKPFDPFRSIRSQLNVLAALASSCLLGPNLSALAYVDPDGENTVCVVVRRREGLAQLTTFPTIGLAMEYYKEKIDAAR